MIISDSMKKAYVEYLRELIRRPSETAKEGEIALFIFESLKRLGVETYIDIAGNVVGELNCGDGPTVLLNGHLDAVNEGNLDAWAPYTPFGGDMDGDLIIGRGASDIKSGIAAQFFAFKYFKDALDNGARFNGTLIFSAVVHEEAAEMLGMQVLIEKTLPERGRSVDLCILCEPSSGKVALGHRGKIELVVTAYGKTAHSSQPRQGINALQKMIPVMRYVFEDLPGLLKSDPVLGESSVTITDCVVKPGAQSILPDICEISLDRRYMPGETTEELLLQFNELFDKIKAEDPEFRADVRPRAYDEITYTGYKQRVNKYHPAWTTDPDLPIVKTALDALASIGQKLECVYWKFGTDGSMTAGLHNIPTIGYSHAEERWAHQPKEQVSVTEMLKTIKGTAAMAAAILGLTNTRR
ncbi:MAG: M20/M25/M40 family metallo-hydrolase [Synergistaceae bacterium]|jgi:putative selenium metabolism hydrolase|nr:M20/M25/M40 family metallo-hydrolase [Synergistaceae bacterium]